MCTCAVKSFVQQYLQYNSIITLQYYISITVEGKTPHVHMCCAHNSHSRILALNFDEDVK